MSEPASERDTAGEIRAGLIGIALLMVFGTVFLVSFGEDWKEYLLLAGVCAFMVAFLLSLYRWGIPFARRLNSRLGGIEPPPPVKQSDAEPLHSGGSPDSESITTSVSRLGWYRRVRFQLAFSLIQPIVVFAVVGAFLGDLIALIVAGFVLGVCVALIWLLVWIVQRDELEKRGFLW